MIPSPINPISFGTVPPSRLRRRALPTFERRRLVPPVDEDDVACPRSIDVDPDVPPQAGLLIVGDTGRRGLQPALHPVARVKLVERLQLRRRGQRLQHLRFGAL